MRTVAGQINKFSFGDISAGVNDPNLGGDLEAIFLAAWKQQVVAWNVTVGTNATFEATNISGNEHLGALIGGFPPLLSNLATNLPLPPGAALGFAYSIDDRVNYLNGIWGGATSQNNRINENTLLPDSGGSIELQDISIEASFTTWTTRIKAVYHVGHGLPNVPFSISYIESLTLFGGANLTVGYSASSPVFTADTQNLRDALIALEVIGAFIVAPPAIPLLKYGTSAIDSYIMGKMNVMVPDIFSLPLSVVAASIPQTVQLPGTTDDLWITYDTISSPQGTIAQLVKGTLTSLVTGATLFFSGRRLPTRLRRIGIVTITGNATIKLPPPPSGLNSSLPSPVIVESYVAWRNAGAQNPNFTWSAVDSNGKTIPGVDLSNTTGPNMSLTLTSTKVATPVTMWVSVRSDDALHLKDASGNTPSFVMKVVIDRDTRSQEPVTGRPAIPIPRPIQSIN